MSDAITHTILKYFQEQALKEGYVVSKCCIASSDGPSYVEIYKHRTIDLIIDIVIYLPSIYYKHLNLYVRNYKISGKESTRYLKKHTSQHIVHRIDINDPNMLNKLDDILQQPLQK